MKWIGALLIASGLLAVAVLLHLYSNRDCLLGSNKVPFGLNYERLDARCANSEHEDKCIFTDYECDDEQFYLIIENLKDNCCVEELITES